MRARLWIPLLLLAAAHAGADSPEAPEAPTTVPTPGLARAERAFQRFAAEWMDRARALGERQRQQPSVRPGARVPVFTYRGYGDDYSIELRATGHSGAPYVGLLRYTELVYRCERASPGDCRVASSTPVTEIFRYRDGAWAY